MRKSRSRTSGGLGSQRIEPWFYLLACVLAYGLLIPRLGFYWDDWPTIFYLQNGRLGQLVQHFSYDRPFSVWVYWLIGQMGVRPLIWQVAALFLCWGTVVAMAWALKGIWPKQKRLILYTALLFAIYPGYYFQPLSVIFTAHLATGLIFFVSLGAMARAIRQPEQRAAFTALGLATAAVQMFTLEYFVGLELIRPLVIWLALPKTKNLRAQLWATARLWLPYGLVFAAWLAWRMFLLELPVEPYPLAVSRDLAASVRWLVQAASGDLAYALIGAWRDALQLARQGGWLAWAAGLALAGAAILWLRRLGSGEARPGWPAFALGGAALVAGLMPVWVIGEAISKGDYSRRYMLIAMFGAALLLAALIRSLRSQRTQMLVLCILLGLSTASQVENANEFAADWKQQQSFYWQLHWRAPGLASGAAVVTAERVTTWTGEPLLGVALGSLYPPRVEAPRTDIWNFELTRSRSVDTIVESGLLENNYRGLTFHMSAAENLLLVYTPPEGCVWVVSPQDAGNPYLPSELRELAEYSNLEVIETEGSQPDERIFGAEPQPDWCYFFEKAALARQVGDWQAVLALWAQASQSGQEANAGAELLPFIEAAVRMGDGQLASQLAVRAGEYEPAIGAYLCEQAATWDVQAGAVLGCPAEGSSG